MVRIKVNYIWAAGGGGRGGEGGYFAFVKVPSLKVCGGWFSL